MKSKNKKMNQKLTVSIVISREMRPASQHENEFLFSNYSCVKIFNLKRRRRHLEKNIVFKYATGIRFRSIHLCFKGECNRFLPSSFK